MSLEDAVKHLGELRESPPDNTALVKAYQESDDRISCGNSHSA